MAFKVYKGKTKTIWLPVTPSTVLAKDSIVSEASGYLIAATSSTAALSHIGVTPKAVAATDSDYALARLHPVIVPVEKNVEWLGDVTSGLVAADVGLLVDLTNSTTINRGASTYDVAMVRSVISSTKGTFVLNLQGATGMAQ
jgi:hypothetical protein